MAIRCFEILNKHILESLSFAYVCIWRDYMCFMYEIINSIAMLHFVLFHNVICYTILYYHASILTL